MTKLNPAFFAAALPIERTATLTLDSGEVFEQQVFVRELPAIEMRRQILIEQSGDQKKVEMAQASLIARAICYADGAPMMTENEASQLKPLVSGQLFGLIMEVNGLGKQS